MNHESIRRKLYQILCEQLYQCLSHGVLYDILSGIFLKALNSNLLFSFVASRVTAPKNSLDSYHTLNFFVTLQNVMC